MAGHRKGVGPGDLFDLLGALQFGLLTCRLGLREHHTLLDIGCGCLRGGKFFIPYLRAGNYFGIEPDQNLLEAGKREELGDFHLKAKRPTFSHDDTFTLSAFGRKFDYLVAQSIFSHTAAHQLQRCLREAAAVMTPASQFAATFAPGDESYAGSQWVGKPGPAGVARYRPDDIRQWADDAGLETSPLDWHHPGQRWLLFTLR